MALRWPQPPGLVVPLGVLAVIVTLDLALGSRVVLSASYAIAAVVAGALTTVRRTALVAALAAALAGLSIFWNQDMTGWEWAVRLSLAVGLGMLGVATAVTRARREQALVHMTVVAETAQRAVLRSMPTAVGSVGVAARYVSATEAALVGGDLYEVAETPYGVRVVVGDVRGKGLDAVQMAATVLAAFRRAAFTQRTLTAIATELDRVVTSVAGDEDFVTAVLAEFHPDHTMTLVNCGHHAPLMTAAPGPARLLDTGEPEPPLGLGPTPHSVVSPWPQGSRLLLYTDGLVETRDPEGAFFPLSDHADALGQGDLEQALDMLLTRLNAHARRRLSDDIAVVLLEQRV